MADNKNSTLSFYSNCMIESAQSLQRVRKKLDKSEFGKIETDTHLFSGTNLSMPILMSFAIEVALIVMADSRTGEKICCRTHDFVNLFEGLKPSTKEALEANSQILTSLQNRGKASMGVPPYEHQCESVETAACRCNCAGWWPMIVDLPTCNEVLGD